MAKQAPTLNDLIAMSVADRAAAINKLNRDPRGDLLEEAIAVAALAHIAVIEHPYLIAARKRAKRAEARLHETPSEIRAANARVQVADRRIHQMTAMLEKQQLHTEDAVEQVTEIESKLEAAENRHLDQLGELEDALNKEIAERVRFAQALDALNDLYSAQKIGGAAALKLEKLGFSMTPSE